MFNNVSGIFYAILYNRKDAFGELLPLELETYTKAEAVVPFSVVSPFKKQYITDERVLNFMQKYRLAHNATVPVDSSVLDICIYLDRI